MRAWGTGATMLILGSILSLGSPLTARPTLASPNHDGGSSAQPLAPTRTYVGGVRSQKAASNSSTSARARHYAGGGGISCVPFARSDSGISVPGNAWQWWENAAGVYARGRVPESGSVLTFRANGRMRLGHVAVVSRVINPREVEVEHANWAGSGVWGGVARNVPVVDVSEANDWTAVRVGLGRGKEFGSVYPTYGFIYDRPDNGTLVAAAQAPTPKPVLNPVPSDLRPAVERGWQTYEEVAEAPKGPKHHRRGIDLSLNHASVAGMAADQKQ
jgi:surface antigen